MFEKEAKEYANKHTFYDEGKEREYYDKSITEIFKEGAEFGYGNVNKWHKVADGDLPKETEFIETDVLLLLVQLKGTKNRRYELGRYIFSTGGFTCTHLKGAEDVIAWCEIPVYEAEE